VEKLKNASTIAKEKLQDTGTVAKEKLVDVGSYIGDKVSKIETKKALRWLQGYPLFRLRLTGSETEKLHRFLKSLQEDGIEVNSALELEDELLDEFDEES
jgi:intergrase/recombinase